MTAADPTARILLVRHGESEVNAHGAHLVGGRSSWAELTERGKAQSRALGRRWIDELHDDHVVVSSTAVRATQTARYALEAAGCRLTRLRTSEALEELDQGAWTGRLRAEIYTPAQQAVIEQDHWTFSAPGGESQADVHQRASAYLLHSVVRPGLTAWVVCHGVVITSLLAGWAGVDRQSAWRIRIANTAITELSFDGERFAEVRRNDIDHLEGDSAAQPPVEPR